MITPPIALWRAEPLRFFEAVLVMADGRSYGASLDPWQREDFEAANGPWNCWLERPRSHSKTPGARVYFGAADRDQAALCYDSLIGFVRRSPLLQGAFRLGKWELIAPSTDARLVVMASDAPGSWGLRPSLVIVDELQAWRTSSHEEFFWSLFSAFRQGGRRPHVGGDDSGMG